MSTMKIKKGDMVKVIAGKDSKRKVVVTALFEVIHITISGQLVDWRYNVTRIGRGKIFPIFSSDNSIDSHGAWKTGDDKHIGCTYLLNQLHRVVGIPRIGCYFLPGCDRIES